MPKLPHANTLNVDETGHKENGDRFWTWCFRAEMYTLFRIDKSRGSKVLIDVLGEQFDGVMGCDFWGAYKKYMRLHDHVLLQFCMAHLIRDVKYLTTLADKATKAYATRQHAVVCGETTYLCISPLGRQAVKHRRATTETAGPPYSVSPRIAV